MRLSLYVSFISLVISFAFKLLLILSGDVEVNLGPRHWTSLSFCHWNLDSVFAYDFVKVSLLKAYSTIYKFDITCLFETFLNSSLQNDNHSLVLNGYKLVRADNPIDLKRGGVCIYFKESLPIKVLNITNLNECLVCEISLNGHRSYIVSLYQSPSQSSDEYDHFIKTFEQLIAHLTSFKPHLLLITGDFNVRSSSWWSVDVDNIEGTRLESITSFYGLHQIINVPTHILPSPSSCIDSILLIKSFLSDSIERVTLNGKTSDWKCIRAGVPQRSILGPLFFLLYIKYHIWQRTVLKLSVLVKVML